MNASDIVSDNILQRTEHELTEIFGAALRNNAELINRINEIKTILGWYKEAKKDPNEIPSMIVNEAIGRLVGVVTPRLATVLIDRIKIEVDIHLNDIRIKEVDINFAKKPYVEYIKKVNGMESIKVRITFSINISGKLEDIRILFVPGGRQIDVDRFTASLTFSIIKAATSSLYLSASGSYVPDILLFKPIVLYSNQFIRIKNLFLQHLYIVVLSYPPAATFCST
jgi:hypothetical protein